MASFRKLSTGWQYRISYKDNDGKYKEKTKSKFKTKKEAEIEASKIEVQLSQGVMINNTSTLADYFIEWATLYKKNTITLTTWDKYLYTHKKIILYFGDEQLRKITSSQYQKVINDFRSTHSWQTVRMFNTHIKQCIKFAMHDGAINKDFTTFTKIIADDSESDTKFLELNEYKKLIEDTSIINYKSHFLIYIICVTGLRFSEAMALSESDIDFGRHIIHVDKTFKIYGSDRGYLPTKNKSSVRDIPIDDRTCKLIKEYINYFNINDRLFENVSNSAVNKTLKKLVGRNVHVHSLRHTYVSYLASNDVSLLQISKLIGHTNPNITLSVYSHLFKNEEQSTLNKINKLFG